MQQSFTLADIEQLTGVPVDRLRYILDSRILPGSRNSARPRIVSPGRGVARRFLGIEAFGIVVAVLMLDAGVKRETLKRCLDLLTEYAKGTKDISTTMLSQAYSQPGAVALELGDGQNVRLLFDPAQPPIARATPTSGEWIQVNTRARLRDYAPLVTIRIDVSKLRDRLQR